MAIIKINEPNPDPVSVPVSFVPTVRRDPHVQLFSAGYKISAFGELSALFDYGEPAEVVISGHRYIAFVDLPDEVVAAGAAGIPSIDGEPVDASDDVESMFDFWLYEADPIDGEPVDMDADEDEDEDEEGVEHGKEEPGQQGPSIGAADGSDGNGRSGIGDGVIYTGSGTDE